MSPLKQLLARLWPIARIVIGLVALVLLIAWATGFLTPKVRPGTVPLERGLPLPDEAKTYTVTTGMVAPRIDVVGTASSEEATRLSARISAAVQEVLVSAGSAVTNGQVLVRLDDRDLRENVAGAEAALVLAESEYNRTRGLFERNAATEQALTAAESAYRSAQAQAEASRVVLTFASITSPMDGIVTERRVEAGDLAHPGHVLLTVYNPNRMRLEAPVPVRLIERLQLGAAVQVDLERPARSFQGTVTEIIGEIDPLSRTQRVRVRLADADGQVLPGTFGRLWVEDDARESILVPHTAVYGSGQLELVQAVENNRALRRAVKTGARYGDHIEVLSGLQAGDVILLEPIADTTTR